jgi:hypothetical protein
MRCVDLLVVALLNPLTLYVLADTPFQTFLSMLKDMKKRFPDPDFILYTGDSVPHWLDYTSVEFYSPDMVQMGFSLVMDAMQTEFPDVPLLPAIGNHDNYLSDEMAPPPAGEAWLQVRELC